jgi:hypothetical protein
MCILKAFVKSEKLLSFLKLENGNSMEIYGRKMEMSKTHVPHKNK